MTQPNNNNLANYDCLPIGTPQFLRPVTTLGMYTTMALGMVIMRYPQIDNPVEGIAFAALSVVGIVGLNHVLNLRDAPQGIPVQAVTFNRSGYFPHDTELVDSLLACADEVSARNWKRLKIAGVVVGASFAATMMFPSRLGVAATAASVIAGLHILERGIWNAHRACHMTGEYNHKKWSVWLDKDRLPKKPLTPPSCVRGWWLPTPG